MLTKARASFPVGQAPADWHEYKLSDDEFSVLLPTVPGMSSYQIDREWANQSPLRHVIGAYAEGVGYVIYVFERKQSLDDFISSFRYLSGGNFERNLDVGGVQGKAYGFKNAERSGATYFLATKSRIYVFQAQGSVLGSPDIGIPRFLGSVKFGKNLEGQMLADGPGVQPNPEPLPGAAADDARLVSGRETTTKAVLVAKPEPTYTEDARQHQVTGTIILRCIFRSSGAVTNITATSRLEHGLTEKAIAAAQQIRFIPAVKDGRFVSMYMQLEYNFNLY
jgi:TonB family protein